MKLRLITLVALGLSLNAQALTVDIKPGLWEHKFKFDPASAGTVEADQQEKMAQAMAEMKKQMASMPPEQRKMMEDMMAKQGIKISDKGIDMASQGVHISKDGTSVQVCLTQEDIDRGELPKNDANCDQKLTQVSPSTYKTTFDCKGEHPSHGEGEVTFANSKSYTGTMAVTSEMNGKQQTVHGETQGKWLSSDCGNIKPYSAKPKMP